MSEFVNDRDIDIVLMDIINHVPESFFPRDLVLKAFGEFHDLAVVVGEGYVPRKILTSRMNLKFDPSEYVTFDDTKVQMSPRRVLSSRPAGNIAKSIIEDSVRFGVSPRGTGYRR
jgi:hypothetical protein